MQKIGMGTRLVLFVLAALLALPISQSASPVGAKPRSRSITKTFSNATGVHVDSAPGFPSPVSADFYPSPIEVSGLKGRIRVVNLRLVNFGHTLPDEVQLLLVGPRGQTAVVMSGVEGIDDVIDVTLLLDDEAA